MQYCSTCGEIEMHCACELREDGYEDEEFMRDFEEFVTRTESHNDKRRCDACFFFDCRCKKGYRNRLNK